MSQNDNPHVEAGSSVPGSMGGTLSPRWPRSILLVGAFVCGAAIGAGGLAFAAMTLGHAGFRDAPQLALSQHLALEALDSAGATATQEAKIHDIIAATFADITLDGDQHEALRKQALDILRAPVVDAAAIENLRAGQIAKMDAASKKIASALVGVANQLTSAQRVSLADRFEEFEEMAQHGPWGGPMLMPFDRDHHPDLEQNHGSVGFPDKG